MGMVLATCTMDPRLGMDNYISSNKGKQASTKKYLWDFFNVKESIGDKHKIRDYQQVSREIQLHT